MKKNNKLFTLIFTLFIIFSVTGCANYNEKATVIDNEGNKTEMSFKDLKKVLNSNESNFKKYYSGATIEFTDEVKNIRSETCKTVLATCNLVSFKGGWQLYLLINRESYKNKGMTYNFNSNIDLADIKVGTKVKVKSKIYNYFGIIIESINSTLDLNDDTESFTEMSSFIIED